MLSNKTDLAVRVKNSVPEIRDENIGKTRSGGRNKPPGCASPFVSGC